MEGRRVLSGETWDAARAAFLAGESASEVCGRFGLGLSAFKQRARREGWRRSDQPDPDPRSARDDEDLEEELEALGSADFEHMADRAARLAQRAILLGELTAADRWTRLHARLAPLADETRCRRDSETTMRGGRREAVGDVHLVHSVHPQSERASAPGTEATAADVHAVHSVHSIPRCTSETGEGAPPQPPSSDVAPSSAASRVPVRSLNPVDRLKQARVAALQARRAIQAGASEGAGQGP